MLPLSEQTRGEDIANVVQIFFKDNKIDLNKILAIATDGARSPEAEHWLEAIEEELESLRKHKVWELTELPKDSAPIACKWVLHKKTNVEGQVVRYKAPLVAKGFIQQKGIDYDEIYLPVSSFEKTRLLTAIGVENNWFIDQYDVKSAYIYGKLDRVIYQKALLNLVRNIFTANSKGLCTD
ncbi:hypothetical protein LAZ67_1006998 [Cordylochernes scorpioides]|uniref:Reverse transcriptase Ty1/copia-type domain-containing protein n=1 Tax=Cordylochernes scorpioides TaxID=51811 RepID=A0ABY6K259_9ARAC|nr:hypothetical protein LAZ67_1006998 [Cordylochernes scorpioides]